MIINNFYYKYHKEQIFDIPTTIISFYDLTLVLSGELKYRINNKEIIVRDNSCILIPPQTKRQRILTNNKTEYFSFNFFCDSEINLPILMENYIDIGIKHLLFACNEIGQRNDSTYNEFYNNILLTILTALNLNKNIKRFNNITNEIIDYIHENYKRKITLNDICQNSAYSQSYCNSVFRKDTGISIINYLNETRINKAKEMLIENLYSIKEIAMKLGYEEQNYFSRIFIKKTKISPLKYRKKFNKQKK